MSAIWNSMPWLKEVIETPRTARPGHWDSGTGAPGAYLPPQWQLDFEAYWARHQDQLDCSKATAFEVWKGARREE